MKTNMYTHIKTFLILFALIVQWYEGKSVSNGSNLSFSINCPPNVYVSCKDEIWNLSMYGNATYSVGYHTYSTGSPVVKYYLNSCNAGYITRTWTVEDPYWQWQSCTQTIYVSSGGQGGPVIEWPEDINLTGCNPETNPYKLPAPNNCPARSAMWMRRELSPELFGAATTFPNHPRTAEIHWQTQILMLCRRLRLAPIVRCAFCLPRLCPIQRTSHWQTLPSWGPRRASALFQICR